MLFTNPRENFSFDVTITEITETTQMMAGDDRGFNRFPDKPRWIPVEKGVAKKSEDYFVVYLNIINSVIQDSVRSLSFLLLNSGDE